MRPMYFPRKLLLAFAVIIPLVTAFLYFVVDPALAQGTEEEVVKYRDFPIIGSRVALWIVAELHLMFAAFVLGVPIFAVIVEIVGVCTKSEKYDNLAYEFTKLLPIAFTFTVILGALLAFSLLTLYPHFMNYLMSVFQHGFIAYALIFFLESLFAYTYYYAWKKMKGSLALKWAHVGLGIGLNICGTMLLFVADGWVTFQMSPAGIDPETFVLVDWEAALRNFLWTPLNVHRLVANVAFGGSIAALYAAYRFLQTKPDEKEQRAHYDWMGYTGNMIAVFALIPLPFAGYYFAFEVRTFDFALITILMGGSFAWVFILQAVLIGVLFISANYYFWIGMNRIPGGERYKKYILALLTIVLVAFGVWMTPHTMVATLAEARKMGAAHHPLLDWFGQMPAKLTGVNLIILATFLSFVFYRRSNMVSTRPVTSRYIYKGIQAAAFVIAASLVLWFGINAFPPTPKDVAIKYSIYQVIPVLICVIGVLILDIPLFKKAKSLGTVRWGEMPARSQYILVLIAVTFTITVALMGFVRSGIRGQWHVYGVMKDTSAEAFTPALAFSSFMMVLTSVMFLGMIAIVFWLTIIRDAGEAKHH